MTGIGNMDKLRAMEVFIAVVDNGSFTKAAISLGITRPFVSQIIQELERSLKIKLLERTTRKMALTNEGQRYYYYCIEILMRINDLEAEISQGGQSLAGRLHIELSPSIAQNIVVPRINEFLNHHPQLELFLGVSDRNLDFFESTVDCVIRVGQVTTPSLIVRPIGQVNFVCCASAEYLANAAELKNLDDLQHHKVIHYFNDQTGRTLSWPFMNELKDIIEMNPRGVIALNDAETCLQCALNHVGVTVLAELLAKPHLEAGRLKVVLQNFTLRPQPISIVYTEASRNNYKVKAFSEWFQLIWQEYYEQ